MDVMQKAERHDLKVLFHENHSKVNGSGKHNWSLATDTGVNLLSPSKTQ
jgi:glutamine synthetase